MQADAAVRAPDWGAALRAAAFAFLLSRLLVLLAAAVATSVMHQWPAAGDDASTLRLLTDQDLAHLEARVLANDASWYQDIATGGYEARPFDASRQANWAFFPLHPMLWRGLQATGLSPAASGLLMAHLLFFIALVQMHRWVQVQWNRDLADRSLLCLALFPASHFFSLPWSESLFAALLATALLAMAQRRWGLMAGAAMLAGGTRAVGVLLAPLLWWEARRDPKAGWSRRWLYPLVAMAGLAAFMAWLWQATGNALAFADIQAAWGRDGGSFTKHLLRWAADPLLLAAPWNLVWLNNASLLLALAAAAWLWRAGQRPLALLVLVYVLLPWSTGTLVSMGRYVAACLPVFVALAAWLAGPRRQLAWLVASAVGLAWMSAHFALGQTFAGA
ncbi:hypothetical protein [Arenimonas caeni]|uniref:Glycosyltransferase RgtA/B/C/D-like domain-containing protein n=1 Tax=Arenimonas caeni TaxID=2058085 RepID=A0A2P6M7Y9_9GAMM|nr:hypothetical protein [Arenimonas caeni]MDY0021381.1 hypothetical protein [Arenimonas caeni]PRH82102.1 hypothetical protein C6N40_08675 [Arenimonas caeni]